MRYSIISFGIGVLVISLWLFAPSVSAIGPASFTTPHDTIPNFAQNHTIQSVVNGNWSSASTWSPARVPTPTDIVAISHTVTYDSTIGDVDTIGVASGGILRFSTIQNTSLRVANLLVQPGGTVEAGTQSTPIPANLTVEIIIKNKPINLSTDPDEFGTSLLSVDGKVTMHGAVKSPTFVRLGAEPRAGQTTITLSQSVSGWNVGDRIVLPDTRHLKQGSGETLDRYQPQWEEFTITAISGTTLTLNRALTYDHEGARNATGVLEYLPHIGNLSRNIKVKSESPTGTRGHTLFTGRSDIDIRYVEFKDLARTTNADLGPGNHIGRYPLHMHRVPGPVNSSNTGYQFKLVGNAIADSRKWPLTVHNSHYGLIQDNVVYNGEGAGIVTEDGNESYNEFVHNFGMRIVGDASPRDTDGRDGSCFWHHGFNHRLRDNVASNCIGTSVGSVSGYNFFWPPASRADTRIPLYRGADLANGLQGKEYQLVNMQFTPIREFLNNETYGATATGLVIWTLGTNGYESNPGMAETVIKDFTVWHVWGEAFYGYPNNHVTFDGFVVRGHPRAFGTFDWGSAWSSGDYWAENVTIRNANVQGMRGGIDNGTNTPGTFTIENSYFRTYGSAISTETLATPGTGAAILPRTFIVRNVRFDPWPGQPLQSISREWVTTRGNSDFKQQDFMKVYDYQGVAGNNFQVYYDVQATQDVAGGRAPCTDTTTHPEINGITCPLSGSTSDTTPPTASLTAPTAGTLVSGTVTMSTAASDNIGVTRVEFLVDSVVKSTDASSPYSYAWDTTNAGAHPCIGAHTHTLQARAYDAANNQGTSVNVTVNMNDPSYCASPTPTPSPSPTPTPTPSPGTTVAVDTTTNSPDLSNQTSGSWTHTINGSNRYLVVGLAGWDSVDSLANVTVTYAGILMSKLGGAQLAGRNQAVLWGLANPVVGANTISVSTIPPGFSELGGGSVSFTNVHQTTPTGTLVNETELDGSLDITLTSGDMGVDILYSGSGTQSPVIGANGTMRVNRNLTSNTEKWMMMGTEGGSGTVTMNWTDAGGIDFAQAAIPIKFASATPSPSPTPTPTPTPTTQPPTANAGPDQSAIVNTSVILSGSGTDPDGDPLTYSWAFGDGQTATGASVTHTYTTVGTFTATLTVSDGRGGTASDFAIITITGSTKFTINDSVRVFTGGGNLNVRSCAGTSCSLLGTQPSDALGIIIGGPTYANGTTPAWWWQVNYDNAPDGWSVEDYLVKVSPSPTPTPTPPVTSCHLYTPGSTIPAGFGVPWDALSANEMLITTTCLNTTDARIDYGRGISTQYIYKTGYHYHAGLSDWMPMTLSSSESIISGAWYPKTANASLTGLDLTNVTHYTLGHICSWNGTQWKCGCRDSACTQSYWQIQSFKR